MIRILIILFFVFSFVFSNAQNKQLNQEKISVTNFFETPFNFIPNIDNFTKSKDPKYKVKIYQIKRYPNTLIYKFYQGENQIFINKSSEGKETFFSAIIISDKIKLMNGIKVGMNKQQFVNSFSDLKTSAPDTINLKNPIDFLNYNFIFKADILKEIRIINKR